MFTFDKMKEYVERTRGKLCKMRDETEEDFRVRLVQQDRVIQHLVDNSNTYDFIFDERVIYDDSETKKHYQHCENLLFQEGVRLRKALNIYHGEVPDGEQYVTSKILSDMQKRNRV